MKRFKSYGSSGSYLSRQLSRQSSYRSPSGRASSFRSGSMLKRSPYATVNPQPRDTLITRATLNLGEVVGDGSSGLPTAGAITFTLNQLPNVAAYQQIFDAYQVRKMTLRMIPVYNSADEAPAGASTSNGIQNIVVARDHDDSTPPTSEAELLQYGTNRQFMVDGIKTYTIVPKVKLNASGPNFVEGPSNQWVPTDQPLVQHYCIKYFTPATLSKYIRTVFYIEVEIGFKNAK